MHLPIAYRRRYARMHQPYRLGGCWVAVMNHPGRGREALGVIRLGEIVAVAVAVGIVGRSGPDRRA
jgi:hypothetical protein